jgi:hypothetical protein
MFEQLMVGLIVAGAVFFLIRTRLKKRAVSNPCSSGCEGCGEGCSIVVQGQGHERPSDDQIQYKR